MNTKPRVIIITGNSKRHKYFIECIEKELEVIKVYAETKFSYVDAFAESEFAQQVKEHFEARDKSEQEYFGKAAPSSPIQSIPRGGANHPKIVSEIIDLMADYILLFGSGIIKDPILNAYPNKVINMHLGLSPYYRGSGTNFWPLVDGLPECVGATIHLAVLQVDAGGILHQVRPQGLLPNDTIHDFGNKTIISTLQQLPFVVLSYNSSAIEVELQDNLEDKDYRRMDLNGKAIAQVYQNFSEGMIESYLAEKSIRDSRYPIIKYK